MEGDLELKMLPVNQASNSDPAPPLTIISDEPANTQGTHLLADYQHSSQQSSPRLAASKKSWGLSFAGIQGPDKRAEPGGGGDSSWVRSWHVEAGLGLIAGLGVSALIWVVTSGVSLRNGCIQGGAGGGEVEFARPLHKLKEHVVILISSDGFRWGYQHKVPTPNINRLIANGTAASEGLIPVFPSVTFPNHYSIATGLYPAWHGIVSNSFSDPNLPGLFHPGIVDPAWWLGEPIWETAVKQGVPAATVFWPGSDVTKGPWACTPDHCSHYNKSLSFEDRVDGVLGYLDRSEKTRPRMLTLYFEEPDATGHRTGPDSPEIDDAVARVDAMIGRLLDGLDRRHLLDEVHVVLVGDHGMAGICDGREIYLEDYVRPEFAAQNLSKWTENTSPVFELRPPPDVDTEAVYAELAEGLKNSKLPNSKYLTLYRAADLPERFLYRGSRRIAPIIGIAAEGFSIRLVRKHEEPKCGGKHGFDNRLMSMRSIFIGHGPRFRRGWKVDSFINVELYNALCDILGIKASKNNGTKEFKHQLLLKPAK